jgi:hypothetical protein
MAGEKDDSVVLELLELLELLEFQSGMRLV